MTVYFIGVGRGAGSSAAVRNAESLFRQVVGGFGRPLGLKERSLTGHTSVVRSLDESAFESLFQTEYDVLLAYAIRRGASAAMAQEVAADVLLLAWRKLPMDCNKTPRPWLLGVARKVLSNHLRSERRRATHELLEPEVPSYKAPHDAFDELSLVIDAWHTLSSTDREILSLSAWEGLGSEALATALGISRANTALRLHRARRRLQAKVDEMEGRDACRSCLADPNLAKENG